MGLGHDNGRCDVEQDLEDRPVTIAISLLPDGTAPKTTLNSLVSIEVRMFVTLRTACRTAAMAAPEHRLSESPFGLTRTDVAGI
jgi:hypothetical protein